MYLVQEGILTTGIHENRQFIMTNDSFQETDDICAPIENNIGAKCLAPRD